MPSSKDAILVVRAIPTTAKSEMTVDVKSFFFFLQFASAVSRTVPIATISITTEKLFHIKRKDVTVNFYLPT